MKLAFFGGSFNPPHNGHLAICVLVRELFRPEKIILSVSKNPLKNSETNTPEKKSFISDEHRLKMLQLFAADLNRTGNCFEVSDWELNQDKVSYTIDTLRHLQETYSPNQILLCIGEDNYRLFDQWKSYKEILKRVYLVVFTRKNSDTFSNESIFKETVISKIQLDIAVSSTEIRSGKYSGFMMPSVIAHYISDFGLYK